MIKNNLLRWTSLVSVFHLCAACASITGTRNQPVSVSTVTETGCINGATCTLTNDKGTWFVQTPGSVVIQKSTQSLAVVCKKDNYSGVNSFESKSNGGVWGNRWWVSLILRKKISSYG